MHDLNPLRGAGQLRRGELVFRAHEPGAKGYALPSRYASSADRRDYYHVGVVMQTNPLRILHCSSGGVKADTSATRWQFHGMLTMFAGRIGLMQIGDSGDAVKGLQSALMAAGFPLPLHGADGDFGAETEQALRQFQQKSGLDASGAASAFEWINKQGSPLFMPTALCFDAILLIMPACPPPPGTPPARRHPARPGR